MKLMLNFIHPALTVALIIINLKGKLKYIINGFLLLLDLEIPL